MTKTKKKAAKPAQKQVSFTKTRSIGPTILPKKTRGASAYSTEELTATLAKRGLAVSRPGELFIATKDEAITFLNKQGFTVSKPEVDKTCVRAEPQLPKPKLYTILEKVKESNGYLEDSVIVLEKTAKNLFGYESDYKGISEVDATNANQHFALQEEARTLLTDRLARVTNALSDFIG